jgi:hypothetical protein
MKGKATEMIRRMRGVLCIFTALVLVMGATRPAWATWTAANAQAAWSGYQNAYLYLESDGYSRVFVTVQGGTTPEDFWRQAEEIEVAEDAYNENPTTGNKNMVESLLDGFIYLHGDDWSSDNYNDDLDVAIIAMARGHIITGTSRWLTDAENNFATVWGRAQQGNGGLCQNANLGCYENSSANWTFVWAGNILYSITGTSSYNTEKNGVYTWAKANLYDSATGEIMDAPGVHTCQCTYNYGFAMIAGSYQGSNVMVPNIANYVFNNLTNYDGTSGGYNVMPDYGHVNGNNDGFNGILMRGVGFANAKGYLPSADLAAAQANINAAWSFRNGVALSWNDWDASTPTTGNYSWPDSPTLAGMLDIPPS